MEKIYFARKQSLGNVVYTITFPVKLFLVLHDIWNKVMKYQRPYRSASVNCKFHGSLRKEKNWNYQSLNTTPYMAKLTLM